MVPLTNAELHCRDRKRFNKSQRSRHRSKPSFSFLNQPAKFSASRRMLHAVPRTAAPPAMRCAVLVLRRNNAAREPTTSVFRQSSPRVQANPFRHRSFSSQRRNKGPSRARLLFSTAARVEHVVIKARYRQCFAVGRRWRNTILTPVSAGNIVGLPLSRGRSGSSIAQHHVRLSPFPPKAPRATSRLISRQRCYHARQWPALQW